MNQVTTTETLVKTHARNGDSLAGQALFITLFAMLLPVAMLAACTGWRWQPWPPGNKGYRTFFQEAKIAASIATASAFSF